jgi:hypothetical protein
MKSLDEVFFDGPGSPAAAFASRHYNRHAILPGDVRQAANLGLRIFPVSLLAKLKGTPDLFIGAATSDISSLEKLVAAAYPVHEWRVALGPSSLCVLQFDGETARKLFAALLPDLDKCFTLQARRGGMTWVAFFRWPEELVRRASARKLAPGVRILDQGDSCIIPPSGSYAWLNPGAEIEAIPYSLRELAFEEPDSSPGRAMSASKPSPRPVPCRPTALSPQPKQDLRKGYPVCG